MLENTISWSAICISVILSFFWIRHSEVKDWFIVYLFTGCFSTPIAVFLVKHFHLFDYPIRLFPDVFNTSIAFDYFLFPTLNVFYNMTTFHSKRPEMIRQAILYSIPLDLGEYFIEQHTKLIHYHGWTIFMTAISVPLFLLTNRWIISTIRKRCNYLQNQKGR